MPATQSTEQVTRDWGSGPTDPGKARMEALNSIRRGHVSVNFPSMLTHAEGTVTFTVAGAKTTDFITAQLPSAMDAGVLLKRCSVSADDTVTITVYNTTSGTIDPAAGNVEYLIASNDLLTSPSGV